MKPSLKPYQIEDVAWLHERKGRALIASDQGTGKTCVACTFIKEASLFPALIVCPASVKGNWANELKQWAGVDSAIISGHKPNDIDPASIRVAIVNYDILTHQKAFLASIGFEIIFFDECHYMSNRQAAWTQEAMSIARRTTRVCGMSGTPISNRPSDFWPILHMIQPRTFASFHKYAWKYCAPVKKPWGGGYDYSGSSNLPDLHEEIKPFTVRRLKSVVLDLPKRTINMVRLDMENDEEYREADADFLKYLKNRGFSHKVEKAKKAEAITKMNALLMLAARHKARPVVKWCQRYLAENPGKKIIVFAVNKLMIDVLYRRILPGQAVAIDGSVPSSKRTAIVSQFQTDPDTRVFVGNITAAGVGITLTAAQCTVFAQLPWKPSSVLQAQDRAYRIGQEQEVEQFFLVVPDSIEEKLCKAIQTKQNIADSILEGKPSQTMDLFTLLKESELAPYR